MNRTFRVCVALVFVSSVFLSHAVWAGDSDGVTGYSMRLKNKDISTGDADGVQGGSVLYVAPQEKQGVVPNSTPMIKSERLWLVIVPFRLAIFAIWVR